MKKLSLILFVALVALVSCSKNDPTPSPETPEMIDLGLSVKWASFNVGASKAEDCGDYFAWGEIETKENYYDYWWETYKHCNGSAEAITKYNTNSEYGPVDDKTVLEPEDDVAHVRWGGRWRIPTFAEWAELMNNCTWTWTTLGGVTGMMVTSNMENYTDRWIFLPAAGFNSPKARIYPGSWGEYWSSSLVTNHPDYAVSVNFCSDKIETSGFTRPLGAPVRPVSD